MEFKESLQLLLKERGWTMAQLGKSTGISKSTLHGMLVGTSAIKLAHLKKIAAALECSVHRLCWGSPDPYEVPHDEILKELFSGDLRVSISKIERRKI